MCVFNKSHELAHMKIEVSIPVNSEIFESVLLL